jgi:hypothetical protein
MTPWLTRCNLFFLGQRMQDSDKTWLASYHLTDVANLWYGHLEAKLGQRPSWGEFQTLISNHFGPPTRANPFGELISTRRLALERAGQGEPSLVNTDTTLLAARVRGSHQLQAPLGPADERTPFLYKLNSPTYDGKVNPCYWLTRCNIFFLAHRTPKADKMGLASCHLTGGVVRWYGRLEEKVGQPSWDDFVKIVRANPFGDLIPVHVQQTNMLPVCAPSAPSRASMSSRMLSPVVPLVCASTTTPQLPQSSSSLPLQPAPLQPGPALSPSLLRVPLESPLPWQPAAVATPCQHCIRPSPTSSLRTSCKFSGNVVQGIGHGVVIPAAVEEAIQAATGDMPSSLVDALRTVTTIYPEWVAMALKHHHQQGLPRLLHC